MSNENDNRIKKENIKTTTKQFIFLIHTATQN